MSVGRSWRRHRDVYRTVFATPEVNVTPNADRETLIGMVAEAIYQDQVEREGLHRKLYSPDDWYDEARVAVDVVLAHIDSSGTGDK
jgi:hypothetical protein